MPEEPSQVARGEEREREKTKFYAITPFPKTPFCSFFLSTTKTLQTVALRVAILSDFSARRLSQNFGAKLKQKSVQVRAVFSWKFAGTE